MQKIPTLFQRNYDGNRLVRDQVVPGCEWVLDGEGKATRKLDGTCCGIFDGQLYKRYECKGDKSPPTFFIPAQPERDPVTGEWPGWLPISPIDPADQYHREAFTHLQYLHQDRGTMIINGTYELIGPKIQGNPEHATQHMLVLHGQYLLEAPRTFDGLRDWLVDQDIEGIVWWHEDGRKAKLKLRDFGFKR